MVDHIDVAIIGGGPGGYSAAIRAAELGLSALCVEREAWGGTCLHRGCIPSKALLHQAHVFSEARSLSAHGVKVEGTPTPSSLHNAKKKDIETLHKGLHSLMTSKGVTLMHGEGRIERAQKLCVIANEKKTSIRVNKAIILATGSTPFVPKNVSLGDHVLSSDELLSLDQTPPSLVIVGGGYIGLELGLFWARMGSSVTILEAQSRLLPTFDDEIVHVLTQSLLAEGLRLVFDTSMVSIERTKKGACVHAQCRGNPVMYEAHDVALALGRKPLLEDSTCGELSLTRDEQGRVMINDTFETSCPGVYAIGDLIRGPMLAHKAEKEGRTLIERLCGQPSQINEALIPSVIYTDPQVASVGLTAQELKKRDIPFVRGKASFAANGRALATGHRDGLLMMLAHPQTHHILGIHIVGAHAETLIGEGILAMSMQARVGDMATALHAHPTFSELYQEAARHLSSQHLS
ncbi:dihydrolipoyl dehydrogenase [bacterium NHP-B]|nr:dihydrolipoyl dehydrogenase [bacterium NHP-B]